MALAVAITAVVVYLATSALGSWRQRAADAARFAWLDWPLHRGGQTLTWSPDGTCVAYEARGQHGGPDLRVRRLDTVPYGTVPVFTGYPLDRSLVATRGDEWAPAWSPDGARIAYRSGDSLCVVGVDTSGSPRPVGRGEVVSGRQTVLSDPVWSPDGRSLALIWSAPNDGGYEVGCFVEGGARGEPWAPTVVGHCDDRVGPPSVDFTPSSDALLFTGSVDGEPGLWLAPLNGGPHRLVVERGWLWSANCSPDGARVAFISRYGGDLPPARVCVAPLGGGEVLAVSPSDAECGAPEWSPDGKRLAFVMRVDNRPGEVVFAESPGGTWADGDLVVSAAPVMSGAIGRLSWSPVGRRLAVAQAPSLSFSTSLWVSDLGPPS